MGEKSSPFDRINIKSFMEKITGILGMLDDKYAIVMNWKACLKWKNDLAHIFPSGRVHIYGL